MIHFKIVRSPRSLTLFSLVLLASGLLGCASTSPSSMSMGRVDNRTALRQNMRELWADHVLWTRQYIVSAIADLPDAQAAADRLLKNQDQIGAAITPYYGDAAGRTLGGLLREHILIAVDVLNAAKANDQAKLADADRRWHDNAAQIATFLSGANPEWKRDEVLAMLNEHLSLTTREAVARLNRNFSEDVSLFDQIFDQAMMMADALSNGIIHQFPDRFRT